MSRRTFASTLLMGVVAICGDIRSSRAEEPLARWLEGIGDAAQAQDEGDLRGAAAAAQRALEARPAGPAGARARLAIGLAQAGPEPAEAAAQLRAAAAGGLDPALRGAALERAAEAEWASGRPAAAAPLFAEAAAAGPAAVAERARWREAESLVAAGQPGPGARLLQRLLAEAPRSPAAPRARLALAAADRALGEEARAVGLLRQLWIERAGEPEALEAVRTLRRWRAEGVPVPEPTAEERLQRAERLLAAGRARKALRSLGRLDPASLTDPLLARWQILRALALLPLGRAAEAEALARAVLDRPGPGADLTGSAELVLARAAARQGRTGEAVDRYRRVAAARPRVPGMPPQQQVDLPEDASFLAAWLPYDAGRFAGAAASLGRFLRERPASRRATDARWFRAWSLYRAGRKVEASRAFAELESSALGPGALYWRGRLAGSAERQVALYRAAIAASDGGWYALLAAARLRELGRPAPRPFPAALVAAPPRDSASAASLADAAALLGAGMRREALAELQALSQGAAAGGRAFALAQLAAFAGDPEVPFRMARDHLLATRRAMRWGHPEAHVEVLRARAAALGVDPWLLLAVMRRESSFRSDARSGAAAEGLLQLLPMTARRLAVVAGVPAGTARRLAEPEVSISFGAYYLGLLSTRFSGAPEVLAAYNAGPTPAALWSRQLAGTPLDEWVEDIPYRETRQYVRTVMADYALYRQLHGEEPPPLDPGRRVEEARPGVGF